MEQRDTLLTSSLPDANGIFVIQIYRRVSTAEDSMGSTVRMGLHEKATATPHQTQRLKAQCSCCSLSRVLCSPSRAKRPWAARAHSKKVKGPI